MKTQLARAFLVLFLAVDFSVLLYGQSTNCPSIGDIRAGGVSFEIPPPSQGLIEPGSDYRVLFEPLAPEMNRLIAAFVSREVTNALKSGTRPPLREYALVEVSRRAEFSDITPDIFKQITEAVAKQFAGDADDTTQSSQEEINRKLKALGSKESISLQKPLFLGRFFSSENATGFGMVMQVEANGTSEKIATAIDVLRVRQRVLFAYVYTEYKDESTITGLRTIAEQWTKAILKANP